MAGETLYSIVPGETGFTPLPADEVIFKWNPVYGEINSSETIYSAAVADAAVASPLEAVSTLTAIAPSNPLLTWEGIPGDSRVLMVLYTDYHPAYEGHEGEDILITREIWLTAAPDLKDYFALTSTPENEVAGRLNELLGLPPDSKNDLIVELWVNPDDIFRPAADPDVTDTMGESGAPSTSYVLSTGQNYADWYNGRLATIYSSESGRAYPWTGLGYSYDWGNPEFDLGMSEFVLNKNSTVGVVDTHSVTDYLSGDYAPTEWSLFPYFADAVPVAPAAYADRPVAAAFLAAA